MMTDREQHQLVTDYLQRLRAEAERRLPGDRAAELVEDIRAHLDEAIPPGASEADIRTALDRVGHPSDLVDEAGGTPSAAPPPPVADAPSSNRLEVAALICLVASLALFILIPISLLLLVAGVVLLLLSKRWTTGDKVLGVLAYAVLGGPTFLVATGLATFTLASRCEQVAGPDGQLGPEQCTSTGGIPPWVTWVLVAAWLAFQVYVAIRLARRARDPRPA